MFYVEQPLGYCLLFRVTKRCKRQFNKYVTVEGLGGCLLNPWKPVRKLSAEGGQDLPLRKGKEISYALWFLFQLKVSKCLICWQNNYYIVYFIKIASKYSIVIELSNLWLCIAIIKTYIYICLLLKGFKIIFRFRVQNTLNEIVA